MAEICVDSNGNRVVVISEIVFKNKKHISWDAVESYLQSYIGKKVEVVENLKQKHSSMASSGWLYYRTRFAIPVLENDIVTGKDNVYSCRLVINCVSSKKAYFYDLVEIKKEASNLFKII